ncbi:MAG: DMT family transporter [Clostridiales bacterium]|nr:DMT family transporter [Clostridiales bacterium]
MNIFQRNAKKLVILATIAGAASVVFIRLIETNQMVMGFYRLGFAVIMFSVPIILGGYKDFKGLTKKDVLYCVLAGFFLFCHFTCWFTAVKNTTIASAAVLASLHPLVILLVTYVFMKQKVNVRAIVGILIALSGGAVIAGFDYSFTRNDIFGDACGLLTAVFFGFYFLVGSKMRSKIPNINYVFLVFGSCWVFFTIAMFVTGTPFTGYRPIDYFWIFAMAVVCQLIAHAMYNWCMGYASSLYVSVWVAIDPVFSAAFGVVFFHELPAIWQYIGGAIAIAGLVYYNWAESK